VSVKFTGRFGSGSSGLWRIPLRIDVNDALIDSLASLARLDLPDRERALLVRDVSRILAYFAQLDEIDLEEEGSGEDETATLEELRPDRVGESLPREKLLRDAPDSEDGFFRVPKVIDPGGHIHVNFRA